MSGSTSEENRPPGRDTANEPKPRARMVMSAHSLEGLVGAHADALASFYAAGTAADPDELGPVTRGRFLGLVPATNVHLAVRPLLRAIASDRFPWRGKIFEPGGGANLLFGKPSFRFNTEIGPSAIDGKPTLILRYDDPQHGHGWPVRMVRDELRTIAPGLAIGPAFYVDTLVLWFGLERAAA